MTLNDGIQLCVGFATIIGVGFAFYSNSKQLKILNDQLRLNFFADYTKRYQEIILNFPENINESNFDFDQLEKVEKHKTLRYMRAYFDLCSEEYFLNQRSHIDDIVWNLWRGGIQFAMSKKAFRDGWAIISKDTRYGENFELWIKNMIDDYR